MLSTLHLSEDTHVINESTQSMKMAFDCVAVVPSNTAIRNQLLFILLSSM